MAAKCTNSDLEFLEVLADFRVLTAPQAAFVLARNPAALRRRLGELAEQKVIDILQVPASKNRGRPSNLYTLGVKGHALLVERGTLSESSEFEQLAGERLMRQAGHKLLLNLARLHLLHVERTIPGLAVHFFAGDSPLHLPGHGRDPVPLGLRAATSGDDDSVLFPDAVIAITDTSAPKTVLLFLEVDMGTEPVLRKGRAGSDIAGKLQRYQSCFRTGSYKAYERVLDATLKGFRVLFLTNTTTRFSELCRVVHSAAPAQFVWATTGAQMATHGISGSIWAKGGHHDQERHSILGRFPQDAPLPEGIA